MEDQTVLIFSLFSNMTEIFTEILTVAVAGGAITALVQLLRVNYPDISPKTVAIFLSGVLGLALYLFGLLPEELQSNIVLAVTTIWTASVTFYEVIKKRL